MTPNVTKSLKKTNNRNAANKLCATNVSFKLRFVDRTQVRASSDGTGHIFWYTFFGRLNLHGYHNVYDDRAWRLCTTVWL